MRRLPRSLPQLRPRRLRLRWPRRRLPRWLRRQRLRWPRRRPPTAASRWPLRRRLRWPLQRRQRWLQRQRLRGLRRQLPTPEPTMAPKVPVESRLKVAIPTPSYQYTMQHPANQIDARIMPIYSHLVGHHPKTNVQEPQLAESWEMQPDGKTYTWNLRQGVPFYKNAEATDIMFSAKDAVHSFGIFAGVDQRR